jgi:hypothetical protein
MAAFTNKRLLRSRRHRFTSIYAHRQTYGNRSLDANPGVKSDGITFQTETPPPDASIACPISWLVG